MAARKAAAAVPEAEPELAPKAATRTRKTAAAKTASPAEEPSAAPKRRSAPAKDDPIERTLQSHAKEAEGRADLVTAKARGQEQANERAKVGNPHAADEAAAKVSLIKAQAAAHNATAAHRDATARAVTSKSESDREESVARVRKIAGEHSDAATKAAASASHSYAQADFAHARGENERARAGLANEQAKSVAWKRENDREAHVEGLDRMRQSQQNANNKSQAEVGHLNARSGLAHAQASKVLADADAVRQRTASAAAAEPFRREHEDRQRTVWGQQDLDRDRRNAYFEHHLRQQNVHHTIAAVRGVLGAFGGGNHELRSGLRSQLRGD